MYRIIIYISSETWAPNASDLQRFRRNDRAMIRWICGAKLEDEISSAVLHQKLDVDEIMTVLRTRRLRWYGHVQCATSCINSIMRLGLPGTLRGRPRKTWSACVRNDMTICNLDGVNPLDRNSGGEGNLRPRRPPREHLGEYTS